MFTTPKILWHLLIVSVMPICLGLNSCASTDSDGLGEEQLPSSYTLEMGQVVKNQQPLPDYIPIWLNWYLGSELKSRALKYQGWDIDQDGRIDYLVELTESGEPVSEAFDFDQDGEIDLLKKP